MHSLANRVNRDPHFGKDSEVNLLLLVLVCVFFIEFF